MPCQHQEEYKLARGTQFCMLNMLDNKKE